MRLPEAVTWVPKKGSGRRNRVIWRQEDVIGPGEDVFAASLDRIWPREDVFASNLDWIWPAKDVFAASPDWGVHIAGQWPVPRVRCAFSAVEGMIWASLCAAVLKRFMAHAAQLIGEGTPISTRRVAMCAHIIEDIVSALLHAPADLIAQIRRALVYILANARRAHPKRDRLKGRQASGLVLVGAAS